MKDSVSLRDIYNAVDRLETKIDEKLERIDNRVHMIESFRDRWMGYAAAISFVITLTFSFVWKRLFGD